MNNNILFISDSRESIPIAQRLVKEGVGVSFYIHDKVYRKNFEGILPRISMQEIPKALRQSQVVIVDITLPWHDNPHDKDLHSMFGIHGKQEGVFGPIADKLMKTHKVLGSSTWTQHIELDREAGFKLAKKIGFDIPAYQKFKGLQEGIAFLQSREGKKSKWCFKMLGNGPLDLTYPETFEGEILDMMQTTLPVRFKRMKPPVNENKVEYILQEYVEGVECSSELWWDGKGFLNPNRTCESKKLGSGDTGPATGSASNTVAMASDINGRIFKEMQKLKPYLSLSGYIGPIDANCIIAEGKDWFLEWTPRFGYSAIYCLLRFIPEGQLSNFFLKDFRTMFQEGYVASQLLSLYPYPNPNQSELAQMVEDNWVAHRLDDPDVWYQDIYKAQDGKLRMGGADGMVGVITALADTPAEAIQKVQKKCEKFSVSGNCQYRIDHEAKHMKRINKLRSIGVDF